MATAGSSCRSSTRRRRSEPSRRARRRTRWACAASCSLSTTSTTSLPACAATVPNSSARSRSTRTSTGSASCVALRASSSAWPSRWNPRKLADQLHEPRRLILRDEAARIVDFGNACIRQGRRQSLGELELEHRVRTRPDEQCRLVERLQLLRRVERVALVHLADDRVVVAPDRLRLRERVDPAAPNVLGHVLAVLDERAEGDRRTPKRARNECLADERRAAGHAREQGKAGEQRREEG